MTFYYSSKDINAETKIKNTLKLMIEEKLPLYTHIVLLCIGTDRITGDSLGPLVGDRLQSSIFCPVYGTIHNPVHAKNLKHALSAINRRGKPLVIAVDAALGVHTEHITVADEGVRPGTAIGKSLPTAGAISITGIVGSDSPSGMRVLQNTRLAVVMDMSDIIAGAVSSAISEIEQMSFYAV
ncbi:MAG: spore protease YyaC [Clostridiales bacterium]|nr:spore protease YyaC [Clostridiales bacterium]